MSIPTVALLSSRIIKAKDARVTVLAWILFCVLSSGLLLLVPQASAKGQRLAPDPRGFQEFGTLAQRSTAQTVFKENASLKGTKVNLIIDCGPMNYTSGKAGQLKIVIPTQAVLEDDAFTKSLIQEGKDVFFQKCQRFGTYVMLSIIVISSGQAVAQGSYSSFGGEPSELEGYRNDVSAAARHASEQARIGRDKAEREALRKIGGTTSSVSMASKK